MKPESLVLAIAGMFFGLIVGWVIGSQNPTAGRAPIAVAQQAQPPAAQQGATTPAAQPPRPLDEGQAQALRTTAEQRKDDAQPRIELGNMYFDAERYQDAVTWYTEALKLAPKNVNVSTDLAVAYHYLQQNDKALEQFDYSLKIDPKHTKTLLNQGLVRAFGKQDLKGAASSWQQLIEIAPNSEEARMAKQALDGLKSAHPDLVGASNAPSK
jgi:small glutamine-rich tetratricopeptide repeat-containing protein alpha